MSVTTYESVPMPAPVAGGSVPAWVATLEPAVRLAEILARTEFVPKGMRGRADAIAACILMADELGVGPMQGLASINVIEGRPMASAELMRALVYASGGEIWVEVSTDTRVRVVGQRKGSSNPTAVEWTTEHARRAGLLGKSNWKTYTRQMLMARATSELCRLLWPDVIKGLYTDDEIPLDATAPAGEGTDEPASTGTTMRRRRRTSPEPAPEPAPVDDEPAPVDEAEAAPAAEVAPLRQPAPGGPTTDDRPAERAGTPATAAQVTKLNIGLREIVGNDRAEKLALVSAMIGRPVESSRDLSLDEARIAIEWAESIIAGTGALPGDYRPVERHDDDT